MSEGGGQLLGQGKREMGVKNKRTENYVGVTCHLRILRKLEFHKVLMVKIVETRLFLPLNSATLLYKFKCNN